MQGEPFPCPFMCLYEMVTTGRTARIPKRAGIGDNMTLIIQPHTNEGNGVEVGEQLAEKAVCQSGLEQFKRSRLNDLQ